MKYRRKTIHPNVVFAESYQFRNQEVISKQTQKPEVLTRPDPPKSGKIVTQPADPTRDPTRPDPIRGSIRPVDNSVM